MCAWLLAGMCYDCGNMARRGHKWEGTSGIKQGEDGNRKGRLGNPLRVIGAYAPAGQKCIFLNVIKYSEKILGCTSCSHNRFHEKKDIIFGLC